MSACSPSTALRPGRVALALLGPALAACGGAPDLKPPPFGPDPDRPQAIRLFFPTGMAVTSSGAVLVVNGNFDHAFDGGTIVAFQPSYLAQFFTQAAAYSDVRAIPPEAFSGAAMIGNYGGPLAVYEDAGPAGKRARAFTGSRETNRLNAVQFDPASGDLSCSGAGDRDCRAGILDLASAACPAGACPGQAAQVGLEGPFGVAVGNAQAPGSSALPQPTLFVSALIPHIDLIINNQTFTRSPFAALSLSTAVPQLLYSANVTTEVQATGIGAGPMVFDEARRRLVLAGCYTRFGGSAGGTPSSAKCGATSTTNLLRFASVDEGPNANVQIFDLSAQIRSTETTGLALGAFAPPAAGSPPVAQRLYATTRNPDLLVEVELPSSAGRIANVARATPLPVSPAGLVVVPRPGAPDLVAIAAEATGAVSIYDATAGQVVAQIEGLGDSPFTLALLASPDPTRARVAATVFGSCRLALLEVPYGRPWQSRLRATLGSCP